MNGNVISRSLHDVGLAVWFGGSLAGAVGFNGGAATAKDPAERTTIASASWAKWTPVNAAAIVAHLVGGAGVVGGNSKRIAGQKGVASTTIIKLGLTAAALGATGYARVLGTKIESFPNAETEGVTEIASSTPPELAAAQHQEKIMQWVLPALTGSLMILSAYMGEQQRPASVLAGALSRAKDLTK